MKNHCLQDYTDVVAKHHGCHSTEQERKYTTLKECFEMNSWNITEGKGDYFIRLTVSDLIPYDKVHVNVYTNKKGKSEVLVQSKPNSPLGDEINSIVALL